MISNFTNRNSESASQVVGFGTILQVGISDLQNDAPTVPSAKTTPTFSHYTMNNHKNTMNNNSNDNTTATTTSPRQLSSVRPLGNIYHLER